MNSRWMRYYCQNPACRKRADYVGLLRGHQVCVIKDGSAECRFCWSKARPIHLLWAGLVHVSVFIAVSFVAITVTGHWSAGVVIALAWFLLVWWNARRNQRATR